MDFFFFLQVNDNGAVSDYLLWESFKAVVKHNCLVGIEIHLSEAEKAYISSLSMKKLYCIVTLKNEDNTILSDQVNRPRQKQFELNDKSGKLLVRQLRGA